MTANIFSDAMGEISEKYIMEAVSYKSRHPSLTLFKRRVSVAVIAAILALFLMGAGVVAVIYGDSIPNWFSHYWEVITGQTMSEQHTTIVDHLSQDIGVSQTVDDVKITVDSATIGDDNFYLLLRIEGKEFYNKHGYGFEDYSIEVSPDPLEGVGGLGSYGFQYHGLDGDGTVLFLMEYNYTSRNDYAEDTRPIEVTLNLKNLVQNTDVDEYVVFTEGVWNFSFSLDRSHFPDAIKLPDATVKVLDLDKQKESEATFTNIEITSTGIRFQYDYQYGSLSLAANTRICAVLENGVTIECGSGSGVPLEDNTTLNCSYQWYVPINLDEVTAIQIGSTQITVP